MYDEDFITTVITNLRVMRTLKEGDKLNTTTKYYSVEHTGYFASFRRWFEKDTRERTIDSIKKTFEQVIEYCEETMILIESDTKKYSHRRHILETMLKELEGVIEGVRNLKPVYVSDTAFVVRLETELDSIGSKTNELIKNLKLFLGNK